MPRSGLAYFSGGGAGAILVIYCMTAGSFPLQEPAVRFLTEALDLAPSHVVGHSLGGRLAQAIAERWPH
ncbi:alpha/beta fold hydrolase, partial [Sinorhizobium fredii]|uniref:alpha/beta fold hydrolase n=1 Tax=Rhizobium fredii TaxID=380 RepID=UPI003CC779E7